MKFRDPKTGEVFEDIEKARIKFCSGECNKCALNDYTSLLDCREYYSDSPEEAAHLMGFEVVPDMGEARGEPRICEVLGVDVGERFGIDGYPTDYGLVQVCEDGKVRRVLSGDLHEVFGEVGRKIGSNALYYLLNHPDRIIRKPRFTADEVAVLKALQMAGIAEIERGTVCDTLKAKSQTVNDGDGCHYEQWFLPKGLLPSIHPGQSIRIQDIIDC